MLSAYGYFPPIETVITPHVGTAIQAGLAPTRKRHAYSKLSPHHFVVYPPPPVVEPVDTIAEAEQVAVRDSLAQQRRQAKSRLFPHHFVVYPIVEPVDAVVEAQLVAVATSVAAPRRVLYMAGVRPPQFVGTPVVPEPVFGTVETWLVAAQANLYPARRRRAWSVLSQPRFIWSAEQPSLGWTAVWLAPQPRPRTISMLAAPVAVSPPAAPFIEDHLRVVLVLGRRGR